MPNASGRGRSKTAMAGVIIFGHYLPWLHKKLDWERVWCGEDAVGEEVDVQISCWGACVQPTVLHYFPSRQWRASCAAPIPYPYKLGRKQAIQGTWATLAYMTFFAKLWLFTATERSSGMLFFPEAKTNVCNWFWHPPKASWFHIILKNGVCQKRIVSNIKNKI